MEKHKVWFDDFTIKLQVEKSLWEQEQQKLLKQQDRNSDIKKFKGIMSHFFEGSTSIDEKDNITIHEGMYTVKEETAEEIYRVIENHMEYPDDENLTARIYTQHTNEKIQEELKTFWLRLIQKYKIDEPFYDDEDTQIYYLYPMFSIENIDKLIGLLKKIECTDKELDHYIDMIIWSVYTDIMENFWEYKNDEEIDITDGIKWLNREIDRLWIWENIINKDARSCFMALQEWCIREFKTCREKWFYIDIGEEYISAPLFFQKIFTADEEDQEINYPDTCKSLLDEIDKEVTDKLKTLQAIKDKKILIERAALELASGIEEVMDIVNKNKNLENKEKRNFIRKFDDYLHRIYNIQ